MIAVMAPTSQEQIDWHMQQLRRWGMPPLNTPQQVPRPFLQTYFPYESASMNSAGNYNIEEYEQYPHSAPAQAPPQQQFQQQMSYQRPQIWTAMPDVSYKNFSQTPTTPMSCPAEDYAFDDGMSCYSETHSSSYHSSDFSEQPPTFESYPRNLRHPSFTSQSRLQVVPPRSSPRPVPTSSSVQQRSTSNSFIPPPPPSTHQPQPSTLSYQHSAEIIASPLPSTPLADSPSSTNPPHTEVDALMATILPTPTDSSSPSLTRTTSNTSIGKPKKHTCPYFPHCTKSFSQPTHLRIHLRSHTGEKPYTCSIPSCGQSFSQLGNLRTHERRHIGQRPLRRKRASSDPSANASTSKSFDAHSTIGTGMGGLAKYTCRLDSCAPGKPFTQLGNLKAHMNKFHKETLGKLSERWARQDLGEDVDAEFERDVRTQQQRQLVQRGGRSGGAADGDDGYIGTGSLEEEKQKLKEQDEELWSYFRELYKNSNKGIKGRGKGRKVEVITADGGSSVNLVVPESAALGKRSWDEMSGPGGFQ